MVQQKNVGLTQIFWLFAFYTIGFHSSMYVYFIVQYVPNKSVSFFNMLLIIV